MYKGGAWIVKRQILKTGICIVMILMVAFSMICDFSTPLVYAEGSTVTPLILTADDLKVLSYSTSGGSVEEFYKKHLFSAYKLYLVSGMSPALTIGQLAQESGWGSSSLATKFKNFWGMKCNYSYLGWTQCKAHGVSHYESDAFKDASGSWDTYRSYYSMDAAFMDRPEFFYERSPYPNVTNMMNMFDANRKLDALLLSASFRRESGILTWDTADANGNKYITEYSSGGVVVGATIAIPCSPSPKLVVLRATPETQAKLAPMALNTDIQCSTYAVVYNNIVDMDVASNAASQNRNALARSLVSCSWNFTARSANRNLVSGETLSKSPIINPFTSFLMRSSVSRLMASMNKSIKALTSACGRLKFSVEKV